MKIVVTGSLGHIGKLLTEELVQKGHSVTVISSNPGKQKDVEALGGTAAIGTLENTAFLTETFSGADAVFCMVPPNFSKPDQVGYYSSIGESYAQAIRGGNVKRVVDLSSYGAHLEKGTGFIVGSHRVENILNDLPDVKLTHVRPGYFYYNLLGQIRTIKAAGFMAANYGGNDQLAMVSPTDIAAAVAEEITMTDGYNKIRYVVSDDRTCNDIALVLGAAIGKPGLQWNTLTNEQMQAGLEGSGMPASTAATLVELGAATHSGALREDFDLQKKPVTGKVKFEDFAKEFAAAYTTSR